MKKAKEYAAELISFSLDPEKNEPLFLNKVVNCVIALLQEGEEMQKSRHATSAEAIYSIILEQKNKWNSICRIVNDSECTFTLVETFFDKVLDMNPDFKILKLKVEYLQKES